MEVFNRPVIIRDYMISVPELYIYRSSYLLE